MARQSTVGKYLIKRLEQATGLDIRAPGFPPEIVDDEPKAPGQEVTPNRG